MRAVVPVEVTAWSDDLDWTWRVSDRVLGPVMELIGYLLDAPGRIDVKQDRAVDLARFIGEGYGQFHRGVVRLRADWVAGGRLVGETDWRRFCEVRKQWAYEALDAVGRYARWHGEPLTVFDVALSGNSAYNFELDRQHLYDWTHKRGIFQPRSTADSAIIDPMSDDDALPNLELF